MLACGARLWWWLHSLCVTQQYSLASIAPSSPPQAFPTTVSSLTSPWFVSPQSTAALTLWLFHNPWIPAPSYCIFQGPSSLTRLCMAVARTAWFSFHLGCHKISYFTISLKCVFSDSDSCSDVEIQPLLQFSHPPRTGPVLLTLLFFP